jgi:hypothetical protein
MPHALQHFGLIWDASMHRYAPLRTPPEFVISFAKGYTHLAPDGALTKEGCGPLAPAETRGTQFGVIRHDGYHAGEDIYIPAGMPVLAPFDAIVEGIYPARKSPLYGEVVALQSMDNPSIRVRIVHLDEVDHGLLGRVVGKGQMLGLSYMRPRFPHGDPSHIHVETFVSAHPQAGGPHAKGNRQPFAVFNAMHLVTSQPYRPTRKGVLAWLKRRWKRSLRGFRGLRLAGGMA